VLHRFSRGNDGGNPAAGLILDAAGDLYGTTFWGGNGGYGVVFELTPLNGRWTEHVLHGFNGVDGANPLGGVILDRAGNLYGTTSLGASCNGNVFELVVDSKGRWTERTLHRFAIGRGGGNPQAGVIRDAADNLYGTTLDDYSYKAGTVFELTP